MGQAKFRGSQEQRVAEARGRERAKFPKSITCNNCQAELTDIEPLDVRGIPGMRLAGGALCDACNSTTWVLDGTPDGMALVRDYLDGQSGGEHAKTGLALRPQAQD